jgi:hypothetical protein
VNLRRPQVKNLRSNLEAPTPYLYSKIILGETTKFFEMQSIVQFRTSLPIVFNDPAAVMRSVSLAVETPTNGLNPFNISIDKMSSIPPNPAQLLLAVSLSQQVLRDVSDCFIQVYLFFV